MSGVLTDETGLHAEECDCPRCEAGYRPTALERSAAHRAWRLQQAARARIEAPPVPPPRAALPSYPMPRPYTAEELADMDQELRARGIRR